MIRIPFTELARAPEDGARGLSPDLSSEVDFRHWEDADLAEYVALLDDPAVWQWLPETYPAPLSAELARDLIAISSLDLHHQVRAVTWRGRPVGQVRLQWDAPDRPDAPVRSAELSYWLGQRHWGQGLGRAMVSAAVARAFADHPDLTRLWAQVHPENPASSRLLTGIGFVETDAIEARPAWRAFVRERG